MGIDVHILNFLIDFASCSQSYMLPSQSSRYG